MGHSLGEHSCSAGQDVSAVRSRLDLRRRPGRGEPTEDLGAQGDGASLGDGGDDLGMRLRGAVVAAGDAGQAGGNDHGRGGAHRHR